MYVCVSFDSMTFNAKQKSIFNIMYVYIGTEFSAAEIKQMQKKSNITHQIIIRTVNTSNTCRYHFLRTSTNWKCKKALISPNYSFVSRFTSSDVMWYGCDITMHSIGLVWLILSISQALITFNIPTSCIASENKEKLIKKKRLTVCTIYVCVCAISFLESNSSFLLALPAIKAFVMLSKMENWRQKCVPRVTQHNLFRLFVITLQFLSQVVWLAGCFSCLASPPLDEPISIDIHIKNPVDSVRSEHLFQSQFKTQQFYSIQTKIHTRSPYSNWIVSNLAAAFTGLPNKSD